MYIYFAIYSLTSVQGS